MLSNGLLKPQLSRLADDKQGVDKNHQAMLNQAVM